MEENNLSNIAQTLRTMTEDAKKPADLLRYLVLDLNIEDQVILMKAFCEAFDVSLGEVTAITSWWHNDTAEMNDNDINHYMMPLLEKYLVKKLD